MATTFRELIKAALKGDIDNLCQYLEGGLNPDTCGENKITALMMASKKGNLELVKILLSYGANPNTVSQEGFTALNYANDRLVCEELLREGGRYESVIPTHWLKAHISLTELDKGCTDATDDWKVKRLEPFKSLLLPQHELWTFETTPWEALAGRAGYAIVCEHMPVRTLVIVRS